MGKHTIRAIRHEITPSETRGLRKLAGVFGGTALAATGSLTWLTVEAVQSDKLLVAGASSFMALSGLAAVIATGKQSLQRTAPAVLHVSDLMPEPPAAAVAHCPNADMCGNTWTFPGAPAEPSPSPESPLVND